MRRPTRKRLRRPIPTSRSECTRLRPDRGHLLDSVTPDGCNAAAFARRHFIRTPDCVIFEWRRPASWERPQHRVSIDIIQYLTGVSHGLRTHRHQSLGIAGAGCARTHRSTPLIHSSHICSFNRIESPACDRVETTAGYVSTAADSEMEHGCARHFARVDLREGCRGPGEDGCVVSSRSPRDDSAKWRG